jgi:L-ascorbate metabolism protein UlaG (beta-lactamase superfamily)
LASRPHEADAKRSPVIAIPCVASERRDLAATAVAIWECDGLKILHCGDTLWHGNWWKIRERFGLVDIAFLPINGVTIEFPGMKPSGFPVDLTPAQAAAAADILRAKTVCPIHYKLFDNPPVYSEWPDAEKVFLAAAAQRGVRVEIVEPGKEVSISAEKSPAS